MQRSRVGLSVAGALLLTGASVSAAQGVVRNGSSAHVDAAASPIYATPASPQTVKIRDFLFSPKTVHIGKGSTVTWTWVGMAPHNVVFASLRKRSRTQTRGTYHLRFDAKGTYRYVCTVHGFTGTVVVR